MVRVVKKDKKLEAFKAVKIVKAVKGAGAPLPIAQAIASMITKEVKGKKTVPSYWIRSRILGVFDSMTAAKKHWMSYKKR